MTYRKRDIIKDAFAEIGLAAYQYDLQPEDEQTALRLLGQIMAVWDAEGAHTGYMTYNSSDGDDLDNDSGLPPDAVRGAVCALAVSLGPQYGRQVNMQTVMEAQDGKRLMIRKSMNVPSRCRDLAAVPAGAGNCADRVRLVSNTNYILQGQRDV